MKKNLKKTIAMFSILSMCVFSVTGCKEKASDVTETATSTDAVEATTGDAAEEVTTEETTTEKITTEMTDTASADKDVSDEKTDKSKDVTTEQTAGVNPTTTVTTTQTTSGNTTESTVQPNSGNTTEATTEHVHNWTPVYNTVHHDAVTEEVEVTKQVPKTVYTNTTRCKACGWTEVPPDLPTGTYEEHVKAMGKTTIILWGEEHTVNVCNDGCQTVPYEYTVYETVTETEVHVIKEAYNEQVISGYECSICGEWKQ